jgi:hypothetical protein
MLVQHFRQLNIYRSNYLILCHTVFFPRHGYKIANFHSENITFEVCSILIWNTSKGVLILKLPEK